MQDCYVEKHFIKTKTEAETKKNQQQKLKQQHEEIYWQMDVTRKDHPE